MKSNAAPIIVSTSHTAGSRLPVWLMAAMLALVTLALYWPALRCDFLNYDDQDYVTENVHVQNGLNLENIKWSCLHPVSANWHPVTMLSHMLDCQLFALKPWGHHLTNVLLHCLNVVLVFALLQLLTGARWRSLLVAALFGWHPLHVESVAWVAERKDVLSTFFGLLALIFYARYAQLKIQNTKFWIQNYLLSLFFFSLGLMSKPMLVTWPFVMLLLDYWPLNRIPNRQHSVSDLKLLLLEKVPFFTLAAAASITTFVVQQQAGAVQMLESVPLTARFGNALISYWRYLGNIIWPTDLAVFYPHPGYWPLAKVIAAGACLVGVSLLLFWKRRPYPYLLVGWLWFLGTLVPVIGLVQVGSQSKADRYAYIPSLGVLILVVWGAYSLARGRRNLLILLALTSFTATILCFGATRHQLGYWQDSKTLFRHTLEVTKNNYVAQNHLGDALLQTGEVNEAFRHFQEALRLNPDYDLAHNNLGCILFKNHLITEAIVQYREAIRLNPDFAEAHFNLGDALGKQGQLAEAVSEYREGLRLRPDDAKAHYNLGDALGRQGQLAEAVSEYRDGIRLKADDADAHNSLGNILLMQGQTDEAIGQYREAVRLKPKDAEVHLNLGTALNKNGQTDEAIQQFKKALQLRPRDAKTHNNLGIALLIKGKTDEAISHFQEAIHLSPDYALAQTNLARAWRIKNGL